MLRLPRSVMVLLALLIGSFTAAGCGNNAPAGASPQGPAPGEFSGDGPPSGAGNPKMRPIMNKIGKGPNSLSSLLDQELKADPPAWDTIQPQTAEYVKLVADLGQMEPAKGSKESWSKWTAAFAESATALDKAAQAKDLSAAQSAQEKLKAGCLDCHREHRGGPGGFRPGGPRDGPPRPPA